MYNYCMELIVEDKMNKLFNILLLVLLLFSGIANAQNVSITRQDARIWANDKGQELINILGMSNIVEKHTKLDKMMLEDVNLDYISKFVIGKYFRKMNKEQKRRYSSLFTRYVLSLYKQINLKFNTDHVDFTIDNVSEFERYTTVTCSVDVGELVEGLEVDRIPVKFKLIRNNRDKIQAVDVEISNVSMVIEYRKRFYQMIVDEGEDIDWFLEKFYDKIIANEDAVKRMTRL